MTDAEDPEDTSWVIDSFRKIGERRTMLRSAIHAKRDWESIANELFFQEPFFRDQAAWLGNSLEDSYELGKERGARITWLKAWGGVLAFLVLFVWTKFGFLLLSFFNVGD